MCLSARFRACQPPVTGPKAVAIPPWDITLVGTGLTPCSALISPHYQ
jgi:hypothetical protein